MTTTPAFLFDLDGTLAHTLPDITASTNHVRAGHSLPALDEPAVRRLIGDGARSLLERALADALPATGHERTRAIDDAFATYVAHHVEACTNATTLFDGALPYLEQLRRAGARLAIVTNKPERFAVPVARHLALDELFAVVIGGDTLPQKKPDPTPLRHALERLGHASSDGPVTMVGDGLQDLRAGKALGARVIGCLFGYGDQHQLRAEGADAFWRAFGVAE